jgi:type VI secretion system secreted protein Hcp
MSVRNFLSNRLVVLLSAGVMMCGLLVFGASHHTAQAQTRERGGGVDYFLKLDGVDGESADAKHKGEIELMSYSWGKGQPGLEQAIAAGGGGATGKVTLHDIHFSARVSKASPQLMLMTAQGKHSKEAILTVRKAGREQQEFLQIKLSDVLVSSYQSTGQQDELPTDQFSLNFAKVEFKYASQKPDGSLDTPTTATWDFKSNL